MRTAAILVAMVSLGGPAALAQVERLPETSRSEATSSAIGRSLETQERSRVIQQQNQLEVNSLRNELSRPVAPPPVVVVPSRP